MVVGGKGVESLKVKAEKIETEKIRRLEGDKMGNIEELRLNDCSGGRFPVYYTPQRIGSLPLDDMNPGHIPIQGLEGRFHFGHHTAFDDTICYQGLRFFNPK